MRGRLALVALLVLTGCGQTVRTNPSHRASTATASPAPTSVKASFHLLLPPAAAPTGDPQVSCNGSIGASDPVAIVQLHDGKTALRDYADVAHPITVCTFGANQYGLTLIDARHVLVPGTGGGLDAVVDLPTARAHWFEVPPQPPGLSNVLAVAPDLQAVAWLGANIPLNTDEIHVVTGDGDALVTSVPNPHAGRCGSPDDSKTAAYARSGGDLFVLDQPAPPWNSLLVIRGKGVLLRIAPADRWPAGAQPAMALWSPTSQTLYYRKDGSVWRWTPDGGTVQFLPNVAWYYPTISADGRYLAYAVAESGGLHDVYLIDLRTGGAPRKIGNGHRTLPAFLNATQLWFKSENLGPCGPGGNQPLIYDVSDGTESPSVVDMPVSVWPATSSNF